jgi:hypothetical protein
MRNLLMNSLPEYKEPICDTKPAHSLGEDSLLELAQEVGVREARQNKSARTTLHTILLDVESQDETLKETLLKMSRVRNELARKVQLLGVVSPSGEYVDQWVRLHQEQAVLALDDDAENIMERFAQGGVLVLASESDLTPRYVQRKKAERRMASWDKLERSVTPEQREIQARREMTGASQTQSGADSGYDGFYDIDGFNGTRAQYQSERE